MSAALPPAPETPAVGARVLSEGDYAVIGAQAAQAGFDQQQISHLLATVERAAFHSAQAAARQTAMAIVPALLDTIRNTHVTTAQRIATKLGALTGGFGGMVTHRKCVEIATAEAWIPPTHRVIEPR